MHDTDSLQLSVWLLCPCRHWGSCRMSSTPHHARQPLPRAVSAREALQDLPPPTEPTQTGAQPVNPVALIPSGACKPLPADVQQSPAAVHCMYLAAIAAHLLHDVFNLFQHRETVRL